MLYSEWGLLEGLGVSKQEMLLEDKGLATRTWLMAHPVCSLVV